MAHLPAVPRTMQNHIEVQNYTSVALARTSSGWAGGCGPRATSNTTTAGTNGTFTYNSLVISICGGSSAYTQPGQPVHHQSDPASGQRTLADVGLYAEDDWKTRPNLSISYGMRYETQNFISTITLTLRRACPSPMGWAAPEDCAPRRLRHVLRPLQLANVLTTLERNGTNQIQTADSSSRRRLHVAEYAACLTGCNRLPATRRIRSVGQICARRTRCTTRSVARPAARRIRANVVGRIMQLLHGVHAVGELPAHQRVHQFLSEVASYPTRLRRATRP